MLIWVHLCMLMIRKKVSRFLVKIYCRSKMMLYWLQRMNSLSILVSNLKQNCLSFQYNWMNSHLFVNIVKIYKSEAKDSVINADSLYLRNVSKYSSFNNMKRLAFMDMFLILVDFDDIGADEILVIYKYLMKNDGIKKHLDLLRKCLL